jgi:hypothetical protein
MAFEIEKREARRILDGIEMGSMGASDSFTLLERADPTLVYFLVTWLRTRYAHDPAAEGVIGRIVTICQRYPAVTRMMKQGQADPLVEWFEGTYEYRELTNDEFVNLVVEKLES